MQVCEIGREGFSNYDSDRVRFVVPQSPFPIVGARDRLQVAAFQYAENAILIWMDLEITSDVTGVRCYCRCRLVGTHPTITGFEACYQSGFAVHEDVGAVFHQGGTFSAADGSKWYFGIGAFWA